MKFEITQATNKGKRAYDANQLVQNALNVPTHDNVTAILVKLSEGEN
jgi:serine/threonine protein phosphatase PrpC